MVWYGMVRYHIHTSPRVGKRQFWTTYVFLLLIQNWYVNSYYIILLFCSTIILVSIRSYRIEFCSQNETCSKKTMVKTRVGTRQQSIASYYISSSMVVARIPSSTYLSTQSCSHFSIKGTFSPVVFVVDRSSHGPLCPSESLGHI